MKKITSILLFFGAFCQLNAQKTANQPLPIVVSYYGYSIFHSGIKIGTQLSLKHWDKTKNRKNKVVVKHKTLFLAPQIGAYIHLKNHTGILLNVDFGINSFKNERRFYQAWSLGLGYMRQINAGITYNLETDGSISEKKWAARGYLMPSVNYEFGQQLTPSFAWFSKFTLGSKMNYNTGVSTELFFELGAKVNFSK